ncbi:hypothetical protein DES53_11592 [Roseimicrobium gellanilyticum]|uniref:Uncharacterized protein n=1 Tax=Roseimicrobium gellanilyticum TaxID=748857 RepID=A0A366H664_9BACT|nr:hypothetical protein [Roseimicrobium gellanilyticum]RBP36951.1 hypothetical protein DES53_11592 [Roseimicrobium gellanilyticum]
MSRRAKLALLSFVLVLLGVLVGYVCYIASVENPLRIRLVGVGMEMLNKEPYSKSTYMIPFYFEVENTASCPVHLEYMWLYAQRHELAAGEPFPPPLPGRDKVMVEFKMWANTETMLAAATSDGAHIIPAHGTSRFELKVRPSYARRMDLDSMEFEYHWSDRWRLLGYRLSIWSAKKLPQDFPRFYFVQPLKVGSAGVEFTRVASPHAP